MRFYFSILLLLVTTILGAQDTLVHDVFTDRSKFIDNTLISIWGSNTQPTTGFDLVTKADNNGLTYDAIALSAATNGFTGYGSSNSLRTNTSIDYQLPFIIDRTTDTITVEFDAIWSALNNGGEGGRLGVTAMTGFPIGGADFGASDSVDKPDIFGKPLYNIRIRNTSGGNGPLMLYGGGNSIDPEWELFGSGPWWLSGFSTQPGGGSPGSGPNYPNSPTRKTSTKAASATVWRHFTWKIMPERLELYYRNSNQAASADQLLLFMEIPNDPDSNVVISQINSAHGTSRTALPLLYDWYNDVEAFRIYWRGNQNCWVANMLITTSNTNSPQKYAYVGTGNLSQTSNWEDAGNTNPSNFASDHQYFDLTTSSSLSNSWQVSGDYAVLRVGDGNTGTDLTIADGGHCTADHLKIAPGSKVIVQSGGILTINHKIEVHGNLVLEPGASLMMDQDAEYYGNAMARQTGTQFSNVYNYWSSPVEGLAISDVWDFSQYNSQDLYTFNAASQQWQSEATSFTPSTGQGFILTGKTGGGPNTVQYVGKPHNGSYTQSVHFQSDGDVHNDYNLLGNPYPSALDAGAFTSQNSSLLAGTIWLWDFDYSPTAQDSGSYADYATWNSSGGVKAQRGSEVPNGYICTGQGFMVRAVGNGQVSFNNSQRSGSPNTQFFKQGDHPKLWLYAEGDKPGEWSHCLLALPDNATEGFDAAFDGPRWSAGASIVLSTLLNGEAMAIQGTALTEKETIVPISLSAASGVYSIGIDSLANWPDDLGVWLRNTFTGEEVDLQQVDKVVQVSRHDMPQEDWVIVLRKGKVTSIEEKHSSQPTMAYFNGADILVRFDQDNLPSGSVRLTNLLGQEVVPTTLITDAYIRIPASHLSAGAYLVVIEGGNQRFTQKVIIPTGR